MANRTPVANCPICGKPAPWTPANRYRPFCSERCKQIDLGAWASGSYTVAGSSPPDDLDPGAADSGDTLGSGGQR
jgi:hypothetical protein